jgi:enoyl-CoA hydratase
MTDQAPLLTRPAPGIARITLRRPKSANRIGLDDLTLLNAMLAETGNDPALSVLIVIGEGQYFSSGFDLDAMKQRIDAGEEAEPIEVRAFEAFTNALAASPLITIAALNGPAIGGATDIALCCDLRIGCETTTFSIPVARYGLPLYASAMSRYVTRFGIDRAKRLIFTGETVKGDELFTLGILSHAVTQSALDDYAVEVASEFAAKPRGPLLAMKLALNKLAATAVAPSTLTPSLEAAFDGKAILAAIDAARAKAKAKK